MIRRGGEHIGADPAGFMQPSGLGRGLGAGEGLFSGFPARGHCGRLADCLPTR